MSEIAGHWLKNETTCALLFQWPDYFAIPNMAPALHASAKSARYSPANFSSGRAFIRDAEKKKADNPMHPGRKPKSCNGRHVRGPAADILNPGRPNSILILNTAQVSALEFTEWCPDVGQVTC